MAKRMRAPIVWAAVIVALLISAYLIVARGGPASPDQPPAGFVH
jgi:hypothetical protein